ncbi:MAG: ORF6N domain-containing protein [Cyclobacteriaceae bacterium]|nr:ORF6N domain-containing protein [Cyclobacteriaceae bacterium]
MQVQNIQKRIYELDGQRVMLDFDLALLYEVETRVLNQAVKRNIDLFPEDFLLQLTPTQWAKMSSQFVMTSPSKRPKKSLPLVFTEHGVAMLANVLKSKKARQTSVTIIRAFITLRQYAISHKGLATKLSELEKRYNKQFKDVMTQLITFLKRIMMKLNIQKEIVWGLRWGLRMNSLQL